MPGRNDGGQRGHGQARAVDQAADVAVERNVRKIELGRLDLGRILLVLVATLIMLLSGVPVAFGLGAISIVFLLLFHSRPQFRFFGLGGQQGRLDDRFAEDTPLPAYGRYRFDIARAIMLGCHLPGHWEAGMHALVTVEP